MKSFFAFIGCLGFTWCAMLFLRVGSDMALGSPVSWRLIIALAASAFIAMKV